MDNKNLIRLRVSGSGASLNNPAVEPSGCFAPHPITSAPARTQSTPRNRRANTRTTWSPQQAVRFRQLLRSIDYTPYLAHSEAHAKSLLSARGVLVSLHDTSSTVQRRYCQDHQVPIHYDALHQCTHAAERTALIKHLKNLPGLQSAVIKSECSPSKILHWHIVCFFDSPQPLQDIQTTLDQFRQRRLKAAINRLKRQKANTTNRRHLGHLNSLICALETPGTHPAYPVDVRALYASGDCDTAPAKLISYLSKQNSGYIASIERYVSYVRRDQLPISYQDFWLPEGRVEDFLDYLKKSKHAHLREVAEVILCPDSIRGLHLYASAAQVAEFQALFMRWQADYEHQQAQAHQRQEFKTRFKQELLRMNDPAYQAQQSMLSDLNRRLVAVDSS